MSEIRFPALDGLRGLAIAAVMFNHYGYLVFTGSSGWQRNLAIVSEHSYLGVDLFFVLSGFLISGILIDSRGTDSYFSRFYWRRSLRIFPLYFFYLFLVFVVVRSVLSIPFSSISPAWYFIYVHNWKMAGDMSNPYLAHLWSLAVEEQFYLVWPFIILAMAGRRLILFCGLVFAGCFAIRVAFSILNVPQVYTYILTITRADSLTAGALMAIAIRSDGLKRRINSVKWVAAIVCLAGWIAAYNSPYPKIFGYSAAAGFFALIVFWAANSCPYLLASKPLRLLGKYSYGIYIYHVIFRNSVYDYFHIHVPGPVHKLLFLMVITLLTFMMAFISWHTLEAPFLRLKGRYFAPTAAA